MKAETRESVNQKIKEIRSKMEKEKQEKIADGKKKGGKAGAEGGKAGTDQGERTKNEETPNATDSKAGGAAEKKVRFWDPGGSEQPGARTSTELGGGLPCSRASTPRARRQQRH